MLLQPVFLFCERLISLIEDNQRNNCSTLDMEQLYNDQNRFLDFFSSRCRLLRIQFPTQKISVDTQKWTIQLPNKNAYMNGIVEEPRHCAPPSPPNGITGDIDQGDDDRAFWDSPDRYLMYDKYVNLNCYYDFTYVYFLIKLKFSSSVLFDI